MKWRKSQYREEVIFDANDHKGISPDHILKLMKRIAEERRDKKALSKL